MKRLRICLIVLVFCAGAFSAPAAASTAPALQNPGFETASGSGAANWNADGGWGGSYVTYDKTVAHEGAASVKITAPDNTSCPWVSQRVDGITPGEKYRISAYIRGDFTGGNGRGAAFKIEFYKGASVSGANGVGESGSDHLIGGTNEMWENWSHTVTVPAEAKFFVLYLRLYTTGTAYFDDVSLTRLSDTVSYEIKSSAAVHYADETVGTVCALTNAADMRGLSADFSILNGSATVTEKKDVPFSGGQALFTYDPSAILEKKVKYTLSVTVKKDGVTVKTYSQALMRFDRPSRIGADGNYYMNGEIFHPVIAYHVTPTDEDYKKAKEAGINVVQIGFGASSITYFPEEVQRVLDLLEKYDLYGLFCPYIDMYPAGNSRNLRNTRLLTKALKDNRRVFAYAAMDEPFGSYGTDEPDEARIKDMEDSYFELRYYNDSIPVYILDYSQNQYKWDVRYCDMFVPDIYARSTQSIYSMTKEAVSAAGKKPVYTVVRTYGATLSAMPAAAEIPHFVLQAVAAGAKGVGYYSFSDALAEGTKDVKAIYEISDRWAALKKLGNDMDYIMRRTEMPFTVTENAGYTLCDWHDGTYLILSQGGGTWSVPCTEKSTVMLTAGNSIPASYKENTGLSFTLSGWSAAMYFIADTPEDRIVFIQDKAFVEKPARGTLRAVYGGDPSAKVYLRLTDENGRITDFASGTIEIPQNDTAYTLTAYAWRGLSPMCKKETVEIK